MKTSTPHLSRYWRDRLGRLKILLLEECVDGLLVVDRDLLNWLGYYQAKEALVRADAIMLEPGEKHFLDVGNGETIGFDTSLSASRLFFLQQCFPHIRWKPLTHAISHLFVTKDRAELALLHEAARMTRAVFASVEAEVKEGRTERDLLHVAHHALLSLGGDGFAFDPSIASGARTTLAWAGVTTRHLRYGDAVIVDLGVLLHGYRCDMARSYLVGGESADSNGEWSKAARAVREAFTQICGQMRPGAHGDMLHAQCEQILEHAGFSMPYALGHGIGLRAHEPPYLAPGSQDLLEAGMVIALEPAIILHQEAAVRYEDVVLVTESEGKVIGTREEMCDE
jgi:Xaa-Pro aminopeptidase